MPKESMRMWSCLSGNCHIIKLPPATTTSAATITNNNSHTVCCIIAGEGVVQQWLSFWCQH